MAWGHRRRSNGSSIRNSIHSANLPNYVPSAFSAPVKLIVAPLIVKEVREQVAKDRERIKPLLDMLQNYRDIGVEFKNAHTNWSMDIPFLNHGLSMSLEVKHDAVYGNRQQSEWSQMNKAHIHYDDEYKEFTVWGNRVDDDGQEALANISGHLTVIAKELHPWLQQFPGSTHETMGAAAYYSSTIAQWLNVTQSADRVQTYARRPRIPYTIAMSPALNTALSVALQYRKAAQQILDQLNSLCGSTEEF